MSRKQKKGLLRIAAAAALLFGIMIVDRKGLLPAIFENRVWSLLIYLIPYAICGWDVLRKAVLGMLHGQMFDESFLMMIATVGAFVTGEYAEGSAVMLFYQVGEWFQSYAVGRSRKSITDLMDIAPEFANLELDDGSVEVVDPDEVAVGDILLIRPGDRIPVDSVVVSGESLINTAALTGEPVPRAAREGSRIISGCVNGEGLLRVRAEKAYEDSTVARILELVENASEKKSRTENFITRFARVYTPVVVFAALFLAIVPSLVTGEWMTWVYRACTFLVISCPCALVISVPLAFFGGIGAASRDGVLVKGSNFLELLADVDTVVTDKTGTLTEGNFKVSRICPADGVTEEEVLRAAAWAEGASTHPIAASIKEAYCERRGGAAAADASGADGNVVAAAGVNSAEKGTGLAGEGTVHTPERILKSENFAGKGLVSLAEDTRIAVGNAALMELEGASAPDFPEEAATVCHVAEDGRYLGSIFIEDAVKEGAAEAVAAMRKEGVRRVVMLTGDRKAVGDAIAARTGLDGAMSSLLPEGKVEAVEGMLRELAGTSGKLAYIGDGINDAPVLMRADVGIAMGSMGSDAAIEAADIVIMDDDLRRIPGTIRVAAKTVRIAKENIVFALAVKIGILILGALGLANMWAAVFADVGVAVLCILNSMRLLLAGR